MSQSRSLKDQLMDHIPQVKVSVTTIYKEESEDEAASIMPDSDVELKMTSASAVDPTVTAVPAEPKFDDELGWTPSVNVKPSKVKSDNDLLAGVTFYH